ncbi:MAG: glycosyltransferase family 9 protein [Sphingobacterium sp.]
MRRILVTRFSAMGDVAMVAAVLRQFQRQQTDTEIILVTRKQFTAFFKDIPRLKFHAIDPKSRHKGVFGLIRLSRELQKYKAFALADLHNNLRSRILAWLFSLNNKGKVAILDKGRSEKKELTRKVNKILKPLKLTVERYADVFRELGFSVNLPQQLEKQHRLIPNGMLPILASNKIKLGIAPFAQHPYKVFSHQKMTQVIAEISGKNVQILLFGGGEREEKITQEWAHSLPNVVSTIGQYSLEQELDIISHLDLMLSMDSSGLHMASLVGTRCVSIWGATHPYAGFTGYGQSTDDCIQVDHPNRPSSVFGNKPCDCDGVEAIDLVSAEMVIEKINQILNV